MSLNLLPWEAGLVGSDGGSNNAAMRIKNLRTDRWVNGDSRLENPGGAALQGSDPAIDIFGFEWGANRTGSQASSQAHRAHPEPLRIYRIPDRATPVLTQLMATGEELTVLVQLYKQGVGGGSASVNMFGWFTLQVARAVVRKQDIKLSPGKIMPVEILELSYQTVDVSYRAQLDSGLPGAVSNAVIHFAHS
jgi:type VI protein secretion system component Hcp